MNFRFLFPLVFLVSSLSYGQSQPLQVLEEINFARTQPREYAQVLAARAENFRGSGGSRSVAEAIDFLRRVRPLPPLVWSQGISQAALSHALDLGPRGSGGHRSSRGETPWARMARFGQWEGHAGENIDYGHHDARSIVISLIVDHGVPSRMHRANIFNRNFRVTGIAIEPHARSGTMCVMNFATRYVEAGEARVATRGVISRSDYSGMSLY